MKENKDKYIKATMFTIAEICSLIGIICSIICIVSELINPNDKIAIWSITLLSNIALIANVQINKNNDSK